MALSLVTAPKVEPVTVAEAKLHLRVDVTDEDVLIASLIQAAREYVETFTHRALITQTWDLKLDAFPDASDESLWLPFPPVASVTSVTYTATDGTSTTWASSKYTTDLPAGPMARMGRIVPAYGEVYPSTRDVINAVTVRFVCGYGADGSFVPDAILAGLKLMVSQWYEMRQPVITGTILASVPLGVEALLWPYKSF